MKASFVNLLRRSVPVCLALPGLAAAQGADVVAGEITGPFKWGSLNGFSAYSIGTSSCNIGDVDLLWDDELNDGTPANLHPVMGQNIFRYKDGRFEQLGQSWLKHAFFALNFNGLCGNDCQPAANGSLLGPGCWDPYSASLNGEQRGMGPKFEVNASTGFHPWPYTGDGTQGNDLFKRIQIRNSDLDPSQNAGARYFGEGQYVTPDDAAAGNDDNNATYREISVGGFNNGYNLNFTGPNRIGQPAIFAWKEVDSDVELVVVDVPQDGRFWVAYRVTDNGDGTWRYEYAIQNLNSDRAADGFELPSDSSVAVSGLGFKGVGYHSGEPFDNDNWTSSAGSSSISWGSPQPFGRNPDTNALRWGTMYNFWFTADAAPEMGEATLSLFKPGPAAEDRSVMVLVPGTNDVCRADTNGDGLVTPQDFGTWVQAYNSQAPACDQNGDGLCTPSDFSSWVQNYNAGC
ncbi:MAG: GC-type dockerin domain-anchored protein [Planctomycetota bacterium]